MIHEWTDPGGCRFKLEDDELSVWSLGGSWVPASRFYKALERSAFLKTEVGRLRKQIDRLTKGSAYCTCSGATTGSNGFGATERCDLCGQLKQSEVAAHG
ncbi:MAG TPA: hypothetical protein VG944_03125 [Fimbriimonas sp.]|nr:hypothetical protein [Fimbriimonas sp.]